MGVGKVIQSVSDTLGLQASHFLALWPGPSYFNFLGQFSAT